MTSNSRNEAGTVQQHQEQRLHKRKTVHLHGLCTLSDGKILPCKILNFCVGGMFIQYDQTPSTTANIINLPNISDIIQICTDIDTATETTKIIFQAKIARTAENCAGVAFIEPDLAALHTFNEYIKNSNITPELSNSSQNKKSIESSLSKYETLKIIEFCKQITKKNCQNLGKELPKIASEHLIEIAETAKSDNERNSYFEAINIFNAPTESFSSDFIDNISQQLKELGHSKLSSAHEQDELQESNTLSLMDDDVLEHWLAIKDIVNYTRSNNTEITHELERRLTTLFQEQVEDNNNPFGSSILVQAFDNTLNSIDIDHKTKLTVLSVFKNLLAICITELHTNINQHLKDNNVEASPSIKKEPSENKKTVTHDEEEQLQTSTYAQTPKQFPEQQSVSNTSPKKHEKQNIFELTQELRQIQSRLPTYIGDSKTVLNTDKSISSPCEEDLYSVTDVLSALSSLENINLENKRSDIKSRVLSQLSHQQGSDENKFLDAREHGIIDITDNVFDSLLKDMLVANNVRTWIKKLEIPLLKTALNDDSIFSDKSHTTRQVVNKISQLELYEVTENSVGQSAIRNKIDKLLDRINNEVDDNPIIFEQALKELNMIVNIQNSAYAENLQEVVVSCENKKYEKDLTSQNITENVNISNKELQSSIARIHRLKIDSWLLITSGSAVPYRVRLAWASSNRSHYVFVNLKGQEDITLSDTDLAIKLITGDAVLLEHADEPALDRAQHSMLQQIHDQLIHESTHDPLTGRINRREFEHHLHKILSNIKSNTENHTLCQLDINQFSLINNACGFKGGDALLKEFANKIETTLDCNAIISRIGIDQFGIYLKNTSLEETSALWQPLLKSLESYRFNWEEKNLPISISIGITPITQANKNIAHLMQTAETCCDDAKSKGNNETHIFHTDDNATTQRKRLMDWVVHIDQAIDNNLLSLRYQPIAPIKSDNSTIAHHSEILLKIKDKNGNTLSPQDFVLAAEQYNRMPAIDRWVIKNTFKWIANNKSRMHEIGGFAINLSGKTLNDKSTLPYIIKLLDNPDINPEWICFEVTETAGIDNLSDATEFIEKIKETGVKFSLDDFGSGLSSYAYLKNLPVDYLKIDGAFIKEIDKNPNDYAVVKSICEIGHFMGKEIIAEFVENDSILEKLKEIGIDYAQGFGIQKPRDLYSL